jgi:uncharacterized membrane protein
MTNPFNYIIAFVFLFISGGGLLLIRDVVTDKSQPNWVRICEILGALFCFVIAVITISFLVPQ